MAQDNDAIVHQQTKAMLVSAGLSYTDESYLASSPHVSTDFDLDNIIIGDTMKPGSFVDCDWTGFEFKYSWGTMRPTIRPVYCFMQYIGKNYVPGGVSQSHTFTKRRGFTQSITVSASLSQEVSAGVEGIASSKTTVTLGFSSTTAFSEETEESWTQTVTGPASFWTYQPVVLYVLAGSDAPQAQGFTVGYLNDRKLKYYERNGTYYWFLAVYRNTPQVINTAVNPLSEAKIKDWLMGDGFNSWTHW